MKQVDYNFWKNENNWKLEKFRQRRGFSTRSKNVSIGFWENKENQKKLFDKLMEQLGYKSMDDWYNVTVREIYKYGGRALVSTTFNGSPSKALVSIYPEHNWELDKFKNKPRKSTK